MISMIWAQGTDGTIGINNDIPWYVPEDFSHFKQSTINSTVVMGRKTWESLPKKPLPKRFNLVLTSDDTYNLNTSQPNAETITSVDPILEENYRNPGQEIWIMGGGSIYELFMPYTDRIVITEIDYKNETKYDSVYAPIIDEAVFECISQSDQFVSQTDYTYRFVEYARRAE